MNRAFTYLIFIIFFGPIFYTFINLPFTSKDLFWLFLKEQALGVSLRTFLLAFTCALIALPIGCYFAWLNSRYQYPLKEMFQWLILSPLAFPIYVLGFVYYDYFYQSEFLNFTGLCFSISLGMIPYIYLITYNNLSKQPQSLIDQSLFIKMTLWQRFYKIQLPLLKPALISAFTIVCLEVFADFGTVSIYNFETFSVSIYKYWYRYFSFDTAKWISLLLILIIVAINFLELKLLNKSNSLPEQDKKVYMKTSSFWIPLIFSFYLFFALAFPLYRLIDWSFLQTSSFSLDFNLFKNTLSISTYVSLLCIFFVYIISRLQKNTKVDSFIWIGYGIPGTFCAVAFVNPFYNLGLMNMGLIIMAIALSFRFIRLTKQNIDNGYKSISTFYLEASEMSESSWLKRFTKVEFPLYKSFYFSAFLFVFIEVMKEMPIQLMTRPFYWQSFSVKIYEYTSEAQWAEAAPLAIILTLFGFVPIFLMNRFRSTKYEKLDS